MVSSHAYSYDEANRRRRATLEDASAWAYDYNDRDELISGRRYWPDFSPVAGQQFEYRYDNIGNRTAASSGGDVNGLNLRETTYTANALNQYATIVTPGYENIQGVARADQWVSVNSGDADRKAEYFHREISVANSGGPLWQAATISCGGVSSNGGFVFPKNSQSFTYDNDGNLTFDGVWTYQWDAENRLVSMAMTNVASIANGNRYKLDFAYDYMGRRIQKSVATWTGSAFGTATTTRFVYDGWNLIAELDSSTNVIRSYLWGIDLSGNMQDAGGIGGLLLMVDHVPATDTYHFPAYDGNGNVMGLINAADQTLSARYEYSPYGEVLRAVGAMARVNPLRWSTKYYEEESWLLIYSTRLYSSIWGQWLSRDLIAEEGGVNLYACLANNPINMIDPDGRAPRGPGHHPGLWQVYERMVGLGGGPGAEVIGLWTVDFNKNHLKAHDLYNAAVWEKIEQLMVAKGYGGDLNRFLRDMNKDVNLALEFAGTVLESPGTKAYNAWVSKAGISAAAKGLGSAVGKVAKAGAKALPLLGVLGVASQAGELEQGIMDYGRSKLSGDEALNLLDAAVVTATFHNMTGNYYSTYALLDQLLD